MSAGQWSVRQKIEIPFQYTAGPAMTRFLEGLADKQIIAGVCNKCRRRSVPPLSFCGRCWQPITEFVALPGVGTLISYTNFPDRIYGLIQLDGADSTLVHFLSSNEPEPRIGSRVEPCWRGERSANILDIAYFRTVVG